jgi:hypothetical protein
MRWLACIFTTQRQNMPGPRPSPPILAVDDVEDCDDRPPKAVEVRAWVFVKLPRCDRVLILPTEELHAYDGKDDDKHEADA